MMSATSKRELIATLGPRYRKAHQAEKQRMLDELVSTTGYHRKYAIQLLNHPPKRRARRRRPGQSTYTGAVVVALEQIWQAANGICGKRLVPVLAEYVAALEKHGELKRDAETRRLVLQISPATVKSRPQGTARSRPNGGHLAAL